MVCHDACHLVSNIVADVYLQWNNNNKKTSLTHRVNVVSQQFYHSTIYCARIKWKKKKIRSICSCFSHTIIIVITDRNQKAINSSAYKICLKWMDSNLLYLKFWAWFTLMSMYFSGLRKCNERAECISLILIVLQVLNCNAVITNGLFNSSH